MENYMKINKRILTFIIILIICIFGLIEYSTSKGSKIKSGEEVTYFIATDTHYVPPSINDNGEAFQKFVNSGDGKQLTYIDEIMDAFVNDVKKKKPDVLIISGDLTSNGEKESHLELSKKLKKIEEMGTSVYVIPGNHDILNPYVRGFKDDKQYRVDYINKNDFNKIYKNFGYKEAISRDKTTLSYLATPSEDTWLLMIDTAQYENNLKLGYPQVDGRISPKTLEWIKECGDLAKSNGAKLIPVIHHNLLDHSKKISKGFTVNNNEDVIKVFEQYEINLALSGHIHIQDIKNKDNSIYDIATGCISVYPQKYGVLKYSPRNGMNYNTQSVDVESWSKEKGIVDKNLNNFTEVSRNFYGDMIYSQIVSRLGITDFYTTEELKLMGETYKTLYLRYYDDEKEIVSEEIKNSPGFKLWLNSKEAPFQSNVLRLMNTNGEINNKLHISNDRTSK
jgi:3',5'-cyclic AMP phosphodiesterase CpdA